MQRVRNCITRVHYRHIFWFLIGAIIIVIIGRELYQSSHAVECAKCDYNMVVEEHTLPANDPTKENATMYCTEYTNILANERDECCYVPVKKFINFFLITEPFYIFDSSGARINVTGISSYFQLSDGRPLMIEDGADYNVSTHNLYVNSHMVVYYGSFFSRWKNVVQVPRGQVKFCSTTDVNQYTENTRAPPNMMPRQTMDVMKVMIAGLCGGLLLLVLVMFVFTRFIYPNYVRRNQGTRSVLQRRNRGAEPATVSSQIDLPPTYSDIGNYAKVGEETTRPPEYTPPPPAYQQSTENRPQTS